MPRFGPHGPIRDPQLSPEAASGEPRAEAPSVETLRGLRETSLLGRAVDPFRLRLLLELDRRGTISQAAEACSIGQPTASVHLQTLEAAVGQRLYERAGRGTRLTDAGRVVAGHIRRTRIELSHHPAVFGGRP